ncbi:MAG: membrane protein insertase YidC [Nitrospirae bacterium]|nr:MAG: membrane protein insertase YidC [Nitrospirota bacterium]
MEKRMFLAIIISVAILIGSQYFYMQFMPPPPPHDNTTLSEKHTKENQTQPQKQTAVNAEALNHTKQVPDKPAAPATVKEVKVETDLYTVVLTSQGASIKSVGLKRYKDKDGKPIVLKSDDTLRPLSVGHDDGFGLSGALFGTAGGNIILESQAKPASVVFEYSAEGRFIRRTYTFSPGTYAIDVKDETSGMPSYWVALGKDFGIYEKDDSVHFGPVVLRDTDRDEYTHGKVKEPKIYNAGVKWLAQEDKYFFASIIPKGALQETKIWDRQNDIAAAIKFGSGSNNYMFYAGPKEHEDLKKLGVGLEHIVDFGMFSILALPLFWLLKVFYNVTHNYGVAIAIVTVLVRIPFIPIINKGQASMKRMQEIQPKMAELKEKYKKDPQKMQKETMELYKKHKVNPFGGCLPMLLQIPVFFALYKVLLLAIELRNAPFALWITDLATKDPYYVLPIIMGATMVIQQKMTPSAMDPMQQKMMMLMPVVFTFMFLTFPSGLVLYWLVNNVLSIIQQYFANKKAEATAAAA